MILLINKKAKYRESHRESTVLVFWLSQAFEFFVYGILMIATMAVFNPGLLRLRGKLLLLPMKEDTRQALFLLLRKEKFLF